MGIDDGYDAEEELKHRQGAALYPLGRALRATYDAENHDSLGSDVTGLMLELTHVPFDPERPCARDAATPAEAREERGLLGRIRVILGR